MSVMTVQVRYVLKCKYCECFDYNIELNTIPHTHTHTAEIPKYPWGRVYLHHTEYIRATIYT